MPQFKQQEGQVKRKPGRPPKQQAQQSEPPKAPEVLTVAKPAGLATTPEERRALHEWARDDPNMLAGEALIQFANERGMALSELRTMEDDKIREQLRYITAHNFGA